MSKFRVLVIEHLLTTRSSLPFLIFFQLVVPTSLIFGLGHYAGSKVSTESVVNIVSGSITFTLLFWGLSSLAAKICNMRQQGTLTYYISMPITKTTFIGSLLAARLVVLLPAFIVPLLAGAFIYNLKLDLSVWLVAIVLLGAFSLCVLGTALGALVKSEELLTALTGALIFIAALVAPTFYPSAVLPLPLQILGWLMPTTYVSEALSHSLTSNYDGTFYRDIVLLLVMAVLAAVLLRRFLVWRII